METKYVKDHTKLQQSNPFDALLDEDSGDDIINKAAEQLKQASVGLKPDKPKKNRNSTNGKEKVNTFVKANTINSRGGFLHYRNGGNGRRGGYSNYPRYQNGANGQRGGSNGYNNRYQNGWYRVNSAKSSSRSSNGTDDGASGKAERSSVKSKREHKKEEFQKKLEEFKYNPQVEEKWRKFLKNFPEILEEKEAVIKKVKALDQDHEATSKKLAKAIEDRNKVWEEKSTALEYIRLSDRKKKTLDEYEKIKEEQRKALGVPKGERQVVQSSEFDGMVVVAKKNLEEDSLSLMPVNMPVAKPKMEAEKTEKAQKTKKKKTPLLIIGGSQSQVHYFSEEQNKRRDHAGPRRQVQSINQNGAITSLSRNVPVPSLSSQNVPVPSLSLDSSDNFPVLHSASGT